jgi:uncharacterized protein
MNTEQFVISKDVIEVNVGGRIAIYHRILGALCMLDPAAHKTLHSFKRIRELPSKWLVGDPQTREIELIQQLLLRQLIIPASETTIQPIITPNVDTKVNIIQLILANACNFGCTYCFEGVQGKELSAEIEYKKVDISRLTSKEEIKVNINDSIYASKERFDHQYDPKNRHMKANDAISYVEKALAVSKSSGVSEVMIQFFGGEPLLNWKAIDAVLTRFGTGEQDAIQINYSTVTNGSLITEEIAQKFAANRVAVCVSFDSPTSPSRPLKNGEDSTPVVMKGLHLLHKYNNRIAINAALTSSTWNEFNESIVDIAVDVGAKEIGVVVDFDPTFYSNIGTQNIVERLWKVVEYGRTRGVVLTGYWHQIFQVLLGYDTVSERGFKNCSAKGAQFSIEPNGSVFACKAGSTLLGTIQQGEQILESENYLSHARLRRENPSFCNGCEIEGFCAGLCLGPLEKKFAAVDAVEPSACDFYRGITRKHIESLQPYEIATFDLEIA